MPPPLHEHLWLQTCFVWTHQKREHFKAYNFEMRAVTLVCLLLALCGLPLAQEKTTAPRSVTVPAVIDHNRVIINIDISLPDGSTQTVRAWVDNGNPELSLSRRVAILLGLKVDCSDKECSSPPPKEITVGGMAIPMAEMKEAKIPLKPVNAESVLAPGMNAEITLPSTILRHYDVLIDFPGHKLFNWHARFAPLSRLGGESTDQSRERVDRGSQQN